MTILQLDPMIPVFVIDKGKGMAIAMIDYSQEHDILFVVSMDDTGEIWTLSNSVVRLQKNISLARSLEKEDASLLQMNTVAVNYD